MSRERYFKAIFSIAGRRSNLRQVLPAGIVLWLAAAGAVAADQEMYILQSPGVSIRFEPQLLPTAREVAALYPPLQDELQQVFGWQMTGRPTVFLIGDRQRFQHLAGNPAVIAYARPADQVVVIDGSRLHLRPHRLESVVKHEMIHLLLHQHIRSDLLPRWLDEGVAQWLSGSLSELLVAPSPSLIEEALLSGSFIPLSDLYRHFPRDRKALLLAYEQSRSFTAFIAADYGDQKVFQILDRLKNGSTVEQAIAASLGRELADLEQQWIDELRGRFSWYSYLAVHLYEYLFVAAAVLTVIGFIRFWVKKRSYWDEEEL